ncbi:MAG: 2-C-methyl-D-erythritol 4-phosphate cytidylyltransferase, partial [Caldimonas sp.]
MNAPIGAWGKGSDFTDPASAYACGPRRRDSMPSVRPADLRCFALVPCAGTGSRAGSQTAKQYVAVDGAPMVWHTLRELARVARLGLVVVAVAADDDEFGSRVELPAGARFEVARCGGASRA